MITAIAMFGLVFAGTVQLSAYKKRAEVAFRVGSQARNVARAGLIDAFSWFRRQQIQPVDTFAPVLDLTSKVKILDTDDPAIGIVKEFQISGSTWARYEVRLADPKRPELSVRDVSGLRGYTGKGQAWQLASWGVIFRRHHLGQKYDERPNQILGTAWAFTEVRRITFSPPGYGALCADRADQVTLAPYSRITGRDGTGVVHAYGTGMVTVQGELTGDTLTAGLPGYDASITKVFGVTIAELDDLADQVIDDPAQFPVPFPRESLVVVNGNVTFDSATPLRGTGVVVVRGNAIVEASAKNFFNGVLYVEGDLTFKAPSLLRGTVICRGSVRVEGLGDVAEIEYDREFIESLMLSMGQYRISKAIRYTTHHLPVSDTP